MAAPARSRILLEFLLYLVICFGLGYATLNRYDPSRSEGVGDSLWYFTMVEKGVGSPEAPAPYRYRVLIPQLARFVHQATRSLPLRTWNHTAFSLLAVNSLLISLAALLVGRLARRVLAPVPPAEGPAAAAYPAAGAAAYPAAVLAPFVYLTAFPIANGHLAGLVDSGEGLALITLALIVAARRWRLLPLVLVLAALAKESAVVLSAGFLLGVALFARRSTDDRHATFPFRWGIAAVLAGAATLLATRVLVGGPSYEYHVLEAQHVARLGAEFLRCLASRSVIYTFALILPLTIVVRRQLPRFLVVGSMGAALFAYLAGSYAAISENVARPLFNALGPLVSIGTALWLTRGEGKAARLD